MERETEKELYPYVFRVVRRLLRRTTPTGGGDYCVAEVARRITRNILRADFGSGTSETRRANRTICMIRDSLNRAD